MSSHLLVIEDNPHLAESLVDIFEADGHNVSVKMTGHDGLDAALKTHPDLIILDIHLPDMSGYEVYQALLADDWGKHAKILVLTASESIENIAKNINIPAKHVLFKPEVSVETLRNVVRERLAD